MFLNPIVLSPLTFQLHNELERGHAHLCAEFLLGYFQGSFHDWPEKINANMSWKVSGTQWQGRETPEKIQYPRLATITDRFKDSLINVGFSVLLPGARILPHKGYTDSVYRMHFGLIVPEGDCCLKVGSEIRGWREEESFLFDDTQEHEAWNRTRFPRAIVLLDVRKDCLMR